MATIGRGLDVDRLISDTVKGRVDMRVRHCLCSYLPCSEIRPRLIYDESHSIYHIELYMLIGTLHNDTLPSLQHPLLLVIIRKSRLKQPDWPRRRSGPIFASLSCQKGLSKKVATTPRHLQSAVQSLA